MSNPVNQLKESRLQIRMSPADMEGLTAWMVEKNFNPRRHTSRFIRSLVRSRSGNMFITDQSLEFIKFHFTNFARVGGLLNQIVYNLNVNRLRVMAGDAEDVPLNKDELEKTIKDLHHEVVEVKKLLIQIASQRVS